MEKKLWMGVLAGIVICSFLAASVFAAEDAAPPAGQSQGQGPGGQRPERGDRERGDGPRSFDMQAMQQRMMERMKEQLAAGDDEWKVIEPRLSKVMTLSRQSMAARFGGMGRRGGFGPGGGPDRQRSDSEQDSPVQKAQAALQQTLENESAPAADIKAQLTALREAREKARQELAKAQEDLRQVLSVRQEAQLVTMGMLE